MVGPIGQEFQQLTRGAAPGPTAQRGANASLSGNRWRPVASSWAKSMVRWRRSQAQCLRVGGRGCGQGCGVGSQAIGIVEVEQAGGEGAGEAFLRGMVCGGGGRQPAQLAAQGGEGGARDAVEVSRLHAQGFQPIGQAAGECEHALGGQGAQLRQPLGASAGRALAQVGRHRLARHRFKHQPVIGLPEGEPRRELILRPAAAGSEEGAAAQVEAEAAVLLADVAGVFWPSTVNELLPVSGDRRMPPQGCCRNAAALAEGRNGCQFIRTSQPSWLRFSPVEPNSGGFCAVIATVPTRPIWLMRPLTWPNTTSPRWQRLRLS